MDKNIVKEFFNKQAEDWDSRCVRKEDILSDIMANCHFEEGMTVLDIACGTGVLFQDYIDRGAEYIAAVDMSEEMVKIAQEKFPDADVMCTDGERLDLGEAFDLVMVYNAYAHFNDPEGLMDTLIRSTKPGGRVSIANDLGREALNRHHEEKAALVSKQLPEAKELAAMLEPYFTIETVIDDERMYQVVGVRKNRRYEENRIFTAAQQTELGNKKAAVVGCGGLGGYAIEMLARTGVGHIVCCDGDNFCESNLNRQILCTEGSMGLPKVLMADSRLAVVNSTIQMTAYQNYLDENNGAQILEGCDVVIDALDSPKSKLMLQKVCKDLGIPMVHGAIDGWFGQVTTIIPGSDTLNDVYKEAEASSEGGNTSFTPAVVAGMQVSEALKVLTGNKEILDRKVLYIDLLTNETKKVEL